MFCQEQHHLFMRMKKRVSTSCCQEVPCGQMICTIRVALHIDEVQHYVQPWASACFLLYDNRPLCAVASLQLQTHRQIRPTALNGHQKCFLTRLLACVNVLSLDSGCGGSLCHYLSPPLSQCLSVSIYYCLSLTLCLCRCLVDLSPSSQSFCLCLLLPFPFSSPNHVWGLLAWLKKKSF